MFTWMFVKERFFSWRNGCFVDERFFHVYHDVYNIYTYKYIYIYAPKISEYLADSW